MRARRFVSANRVFGLAGGNEDNDLWVHQDDDTIQSVWEPTPEERGRIARGANVLLTVWGQGTPPVAITTTDVALGKRPA